MNQTDAELKYRKALDNGSLEIPGVIQTTAIKRVADVELPEGYSMVVEDEARVGVPAFYRVTHDETGLNYRDNDLARAYSKLSSDVSRRLS